MLQRLEFGFQLVVNSPYFKSTPTQLAFVRGYDCQTLTADPVTNQVHVKHYHYKIKVSHAPTLTLTHPNPPSTADNPKPNLPSRVTITLLNDRLPRLHSHLSNCLIPIKTALTVTTFGPNAKRECSPCQLPLRTSSSTQRTSAQAT